MSEKKDFVDDLMNRAFNFKAPEMPDFARITEDHQVEELDWEQLEYLNAAGKMEIENAQSFRNIVEKTTKNG